jgi:hypothetical protein
MGGPWRLPVAGLVLGQRHRLALDTRPIIDQPSHEMTHQRMTVAVIGRCVAITRRIAAGILRQAVEHPFTFDKLDASPGTLWPRNPEETTPPRWQLGGVQARAHRPIPGRKDRGRAIRRPGVRVPSTPWEAGS